MDPLLAGNHVTSVVAIHATIRVGRAAMVAPTSAGAAQVRDIVAMTAPTLALAPQGLVPPVAEHDATRWMPISDVVTRADRGGTRSAPRRRRTVDGSSHPAPARPKGVVHSLNTMLVATRN